LHDGAKISLSLAVAIPAHQPQDRLVFKDASAVAGRFCEFTLTSVVRIAPVFWYRFFNAFGDAPMTTLGTNTATASASVSGLVASAVAITTATAIAANPGLYDQFIASMTSPVAWSAAVIQSKVIDFVTYILTQPAALIGWTESE
jgi:hypothetical protein